MPDVYVILFGFLLLAFSASYIIPAGTYERTEIDGVTQVVPDSFQYISAEPLSLLDVFSAIQVGLAGAGSIIFLILIVGGIIKVIEYTGAINSAIHSFIQKSAMNGRAFTCPIVFGVAVSLSIQRAILWHAKGCSLLCLSRARRKSNTVKVILDRATSPKEPS